jgi:hypothetical protein
MPLLPPGATRSYSSEGLTRRQTLARLTAAPEASQHWADQVSDAIKSLAALAPGDDPMIRDGREISDRTFQAAAANAREHQRPDEAREYLAMGLSVNEQSAVLTREAIAIAQAQPAAESVKAQPSAIAAIAASAADAAVKTSPARNPTATPAGVAVFPTATAATDAPPQTVEGFAQRARQQMLDGNTTQALDTLAAGRKRFGGAAALKTLEITYDRVAEEFDRISNTGTLSLKDHQQWLSEIQTLAGDQYAQIEQMLARTLANDIADQKAADRSAVVANLTDAGRKLFPEYAALLDQGKAGTQDGPNDPRVVVAEKPAQTASTAQAAK